MGDDRESTDAYRAAGVDIEAGDALVERIKPMAASTSRPEVLSGLGGFGGLFAVPSGYRDPVLVSGTDGVGTKLLVAQALGEHRTIGIDLVAMCVNDIAVSGADPLFFLDYFATGRLSVDEGAQVVEGIAEGCRQAGCALLGGETAEMPGMYAPGHYDLAGFAVGVVERDRILDGRTVSAGWKLVGLPSSGLHSNGYSLVRKVLVDSGRFDLDVDPGGLGGPLGAVLLTPTTIYVEQLEQLRAQFPVGALCHITGGGLPGNLPRVLPQGTGVRLFDGSWIVPPVFRLLEREGQLTEADMLRTFNVGIGMVCVVPPEAADAVADAANGSVIGEITAEPGFRADLASQR